MGINIPQRRITDIIISSIRAKQFTNEELFQQAMELLKFAINIEKIREMPRK